MSLAEFCTGSATFCRKRNIRSRTDPGFPTPGARMTVVYTNSLKLFIIIYLFPCFSQNCFHRFSDFVTNRSLFRALQALKGP